ncbi:DUF5050 domain-containing protein [Clostridium drakei]|nr:DUF5050 domain-containing protein [Clostridium drakei]
MFLFRNKEIDKLKQELKVLKNEKQLLLDKYEKLDKELHKFENENKKLLERAELAEKFETADRFHKFLESFGKKPKLVDLIFELEKDNKDVQKIVSAFNKNESILINEKSSYLFQYTDKKDKSQPKIEDIEDMSKKIDTELNQIVSAGLERIENEKKEKRKKEEEERFGKVLYSEDDTIRYGNTPGNIANGGRCCIYGDRIYIGLKNKIMIEYSKKTGEKVKEYRGFNLGKLAVIHNKLFYGNIRYEKFIAFLGNRNIECFTCFKGEFYWGSQTIYDGRLYFTNRDDGDRIYYCSLQGQNVTELSSNALPAKRGTELSFSSDWVYYNSTSGFARINSNNSSFELLPNGLYGIICSPKGVYGLISKNYRSQLYYFKHTNPEETILIIDDVICFNLNKNKIVFSSRNKKGLFTANSDGSEIRMIVQYTAWSINIVNDWVYFKDSNMMDDYYRVRIDGTGLTRLKEGEPLYVVD